MICRLCLVESTSDVLNIFDDKGIQLQIADIISKHLWFRPSKEDSISDKICCSCWTRVDSFHQFYCFVEHTQANFISVTTKTDSNFNSSTLFQVTLDDLKKEEIYSENFDGNKINEWQLEDNLTTKYQHIVDKNDPLLDKDIEVKYENYVTNIITTKKDKDSSHENERQRITRYSKKQNETNIINNNAKRDSNQSRRVQKQGKNICLKQKYKKSKTKCESKESQHNTIITKSKELSLENKSTKHNLDVKTDKLEQQKKIEEEDKYIAQFINMNCDICHENFSRFSELKSHFFKEHKTKSGYVICCNKRLFTRTPLLQHIKYHLNPDIFKCKICDKKFKNADNLKYHIKFRHELEESKFLPCNVCQKKFPSLSFLNRHKLKHDTHSEKRFKCNSCDKSYPTEAQLKYHVRCVHEKAYRSVCDICARVFQCNKLLEKHRLEHDGIKEPKAQCQKCGTWLKKESYMKKHMKQHEEALLGLKCQICGKEVTSKVALRVHIQYNHKKERIFKCSFCEKAFKEKRTLEEHITTHTGGALYTCSFCPQTFNSKANMYSHRKRAHPKEWEDLMKQNGIIIADHKTNCT